VIIGEGAIDFDITLTDVATRDGIALADGKILSAKMDNPVTKITRDCSDEALTRCGEARPDPTLRRIEMALIRD
jgi:hypothetical protein